MVRKYRTVRLSDTLKKEPSRGHEHQPGSRICAPMILAMGAYLRVCTVQCSVVMRFRDTFMLVTKSVSWVDTSSSQVAVDWYRQVVQYHSNKPINCSQPSCYEADVRP